MHICCYICFVLNIIFFSWWWVVEGSQCLPYTLWDLSSIPVRFGLFFASVFKVNKNNSNLWWMLWQKSLFQKNIPATPDNGTGTNAVMDFFFSIFIYCNWDFCSLVNLGPMHPKWESCLKLVTRSVPGYTFYMITSFPRIPITMQYALWCIATSSKIPITMKYALWFVASSSSIPIIMQYALLFIASSPKFQSTCGMLSGL